MKKLTFVAAATIAAATLVGCGNSTPKANLKTDVDTLSYAVGLAQTQGLRELPTSTSSSKVLTMESILATTRRRQPILPVYRLVSR